MLEVTELTTAKSHILGLAKFFEQSGQGVPVPYRLLATHGVEMAPPVNPYPNPGKAGECFYNAYQRMSMHRGLRYCEGYAIPGDTGVALEHAWLVDEGGNAVDPTWCHGTSYFGMIFPKTKVFKVAVLTGHYGILPNLYMLKMSPDEVVAFLSSK